MDDVAPAGQTSDRVTQHLLAEGLLRTEDADRARQVVAAALVAPVAHPEGTDSTVARFVEVIAYVGAALVVASGLMLLALGWDDLGEVGQVVALALIAVLLGAAGAVAQDRTDPVNHVRRRLAGTLYSGAAVSAGFAVAVGVEHRHDGPWDAWTPGIAGGLVTLAVALVGYRLSGTAVGVVTVLAGALVAVPALAASAEEEALWIGGAILAVGLVWTVVTETGLFAERTVARALGCSTAVFGGQFIALASDRHALGYVLTAGLVVGALLLYLAQLAWPYLTAAVIGITFVVPEAVSDWTGGDLSVIWGVLLTGVTLLVASFAAWRLRDETTD